MKILQLFNNIFLKTFNSLLKMFIEILEVKVKGREGEGTINANKKSGIVSNVFEKRQTEM